MASAPLLDESSTLLTDLDPNPLMILDRDRRIVYGNPAAQRLAGVDGNADIAGRRIGEVLHCIHSSEPEGCGSTPCCQFCGANIGIRAGLRSEPHDGECRITAAGDSTNVSVEYAIHSSPIMWKGEHAVFCSLRDVSNEKRRKVLEHTFFTDILRVAISLKITSEQLMFARADLKPDAARMVQTVYETSGLLLSEIRGQKVLLAAETGSFEVVRKPVDVADCLTDAAALVSHLQIAQDKRIRVIPSNVTATIETDPVLLGQVLTHLLKNALESTLAGGEVRIGAEQAGDKIQFIVWNEGLISPEARSQMFQRSFSTKGAGRGIGTYSLRLFAEGYLGGRVSYSSSVYDGTRFVVTLPMRP